MDLCGLVNRRSRDVVPESASALIRDLLRRRRTRPRLGLTAGRGDESPQDLRLHAEAGSAFCARIGRSIIEKATVSPVSSTDSPASTRKS